MHSNDAIYKLFWFNWLFPHPFRLCFINGNLSGCQCKYTKPPELPSDYCSTRMVEFCCWRSLTIKVWKCLLSPLPTIFFINSQQISITNSFSLYIILSMGYCLCTTTMLIQSLLKKFCRLVISRILSSITYKWPIFHTFNCVRVITLSQLHMNK